MRSDRWTTACASPLDESGREPTLLGSRTRHGTPVPPATNSIERALRMAGGVGCTQPEESVESDAVRLDDALEGDPAHRRREVRQLPRDPPVDLRRGAAFPRHQLAAGGEVDDEAGENCSLRRGAGLHGANATKVRSATGDEPDIVALAVESTQLERGWRRQVCGGRYRCVHSVTRATKQATQLNPAAGTGGDIVAPSRAPATT
jgi:hypothetical protein